jgi:GNAT superfamily N-acetyltransferase
MLYTVAESSAMRVGATGWSLALRALRSRLSHLNSVSRLLTANTWAAQMSPQYELTESPPPEAFQKMWEPLLKFNEAAVGNAAARTLAVLLKDPTTDELIGGLWARSLWGSLYIDIMFVPEALRGTGIGTSLLRQAEQEAMRRGCREMWLDTYAFQARSLYEKFGFTVFGRLDGPAPIFPRFFLKKALDAKERTPS